MRKFTADEFKDALEGMTSEEIVAFLVGEGYPESDAAWMAGLHLGLHIPASKFTLRTPEGRALIRSSGRYDALFAKHGLLDVLYQDVPEDEWPDFGADASDEDDEDEAAS